MFTKRLIISQLALLNIYIIYKLINYFIFFILEDSQSEAFNKNLIFGKLIAHTVLKICYLTFKDIKIIVCTSHKEPQICSNFDLLFLKNYLILFKSIQSNFYLNLNFIK